MSDSHDAAEHLRVIRNLMERATVYRAISAPTALVASVLTIVTCGILYQMNQGEDAALGPMVFMGTWLAVLLIVDCFNFLLMLRDAKRRNASVITQSMMHAVTSLLPPLFAGAVASMLVVHESFLLAGICWAVFYGLALLATHSFAPTSIKVLGTVFLLAGLVMWTAHRFIDFKGADGSDLQVSLLFMVTTFGVFHLIYALAVGLRTRFRISDEEPQVA